jgi:hypothetical protein
MHMVSVLWMSLPRALAALPLLFVAGLVPACGSSGSAAGGGPVTLDGAPDGTGDGSAVGDGASSMFTVTLHGEAEVPGPGDPDGSGSATLRLQPGRSQLCYRIEVQGISGVDGTSLNQGPAGEQGAVVLGLDPPEGGSVEGCVTADPDLLDRVGRSPGDYYLNVRSDEHPDGAARGQLAPKGSS